MLRGSVGCRGPGHGEEVFLAGDRIKGPARDQLADELAAFANSSGGVVVLGVSDEPRAVTGIPLEHFDALERYVSEIANDSITPRVVPLIEKLELPDADGRMRPVLKVEIPRGFFVHQSPGGYCIVSEAPSVRWSPQFLPGCSSSAANRESDSSIGRSLRRRRSTIWTRVWWIGFAGRSAATTGRPRSRSWT